MQIGFSDRAGGPGSGVRVHDIGTGNGSGIDPGNGCRERIETTPETGTGNKPTPGADRNDEKTIHAYNMYILFFLRKKKKTLVIRISIQYNKDIHTTEFLKRGCNMSNFYGVVGYWKVIVNDTEVFFADRHAGETIETATDDAKKTFGENVIVIDGGSICRNK